jgi:glycosyltransferase involved in cell wall biosynthesis
LARFAVSHGADPRRVRVSPNGIDSDVFQLRDRNLAREEFGVSRGRKVVVSAGELIEAKGHHLVIRALKELNEQGIDCELFVAGALARGGAPFEEEIRRTVSQCGLADRVRFTGWVKRERLAHLMAAADVFCLASFIEGWPNVVNEALACGTPVVATAVGAVPEMIPDESYGLVVPPREVDALTVALRRALTQEWQRDKIAAWGRSRSWEDVAREVVANIGRTLTQAGTGAVERSRGAGTAAAREAAPPQN